MFVALTATPRRHGAEHALGRAIVRGRRCGLACASSEPKGRAARRGAARAARREQATRTTRQRTERRDRSRPAALQPRRSEHGAGDQARDRARGVVEVDRGLRARVRRGGSAASSGQRRCSAASGASSGRPASGSEQIAGGRRGRDCSRRRLDAARSGSVTRRPDDPGRRAADRGVAALRTATRRPARSAARSTAVATTAIAAPATAITAPARRRPWATAYQMPSIATTSPICSFVRQAAPGAERERQQPVLVEEPDRPEEQRRRERDRVEVVDHEPLRRRVEEVDEREPEARPVRAEVLAGEQVHGHGAERDARRPATTRSSDGSGHSHQSGARTHDDRIEVRAEPRDLLRPGGR